MLRNRLECKINFTLPALLPNKFNMTMQGPVSSSENIRSKRAIPALAIIQGITAIGGMMIKDVNALVHNPGSHNCAVFMLYTYIILPQT